MSPTTPLDTTTFLVPYQRKHYENLEHGSTKRLLALNNLKLTQYKIYARKCEIKNISTFETRNFLIQHHIHGFAAAKVKYGLFYNNDLVYVMTFTKSNLSRGNYNT